MPSSHRLLNERLSKRWQAWLHLRNKTRARKLFILAFRLVRIGAAGFGWRVGAVGCAPRRLHNSPPPAAAPRQSRPLPSLSFPNTSTPCPNVSLPYKLNRQDPTYDRKNNRSVLLLLFPTDFQPTSFPARYRLTANKRPDPAVKAPL